MALSSPLAYLSAFAGDSWSSSSVLLTLLVLDHSHWEFPYPTNHSESHSVRLPLFPLMQTNVSSFTGLIHRNLCIVYNLFCDSFTLFLSASIVCSCASKLFKDIRSGSESKNDDRCCMCFFSNVVTLHTVVLEPLVVLLKTYLLFTV